jgi:hypothetical protein
MKTMKSIAYSSLLCVLASQLRADSVDYVHVRIRSEQTTASSVLKEPKMPADFYQAAHAFDGKVETAWCEGAEGSGIGEWLE